MADSATTRNRFRKQSVGSNNNTWGTNLNEVLDCIDQVTDGVQTISTVGDHTLTTTNYTTADEAKNRVILRTGTQTAETDLIVPSVEHEYRVYNNTVGGFGVVAKTSAGTGVTIPAGFECRVYCDGTNVEAHATYVNGAMEISGALEVGGIISGGTAAVATTDFTILSQVNALIAAGGGTGAAAGTVKIDAAATAAYLFQALLASGLLTMADNGNSMNVQVAVYTAAGTDTYTITPDPAVTAWTAGISTFLVLFTNANATTTPTLNPNGIGAKTITKAGATALAVGDIPAGSVKLCVYDGTQVQIIPGGPVAFEDENNIIANRVFG